MRKSAERNLWTCLALVGVVAVAVRCAPAHEPLHNRPSGYKHNSAIYLEYGRRMRIGFGYQVRAMCRQNADLIKKFKVGDYDHRPAEFEADTSAFSGSLLNFMELFEDQQIPREMTKSHAKISNCSRLCYESTQTLRQANRFRGEERVRRVHEAEQKLKQAWASGNEGLQLHNAIWAQTRT